MDLLGRLRDPLLSLTLNVERRPATAPIIDPPVSRNSDLEHIHAWLDELGRMRKEHGRSPSVVSAIDQAIARAIGWLDGEDELSGRMGSDG